MLKNLKSLFFVSEEDESDEKANKDQPKNQGVGSDKGLKPSDKPIGKKIAVPDSKGQVDNKIIGKLLEAIDRNDMEGFDYLEYKKSLKALDKMPMDEATKYRSAFATAATLGVTLDKLVDSTNYYLTVLNNENDQFLSTFKTEFAKKVSDKEKEIIQYEAIIKEKSEKIKLLTEEINKHQKQIESMKLKIDEGKSKINKTQEDFKLSFNHVKSMFEEDIVKMKKYLK